ncbi:efflux RND transporter periplasmic adaptor subunit [Aneurinibacillus terranovensis]|uniref:efflux RND transporter periplasmic adaptor subunit n=1 Tax=Aneurinibacillus terranovensis TaxID=278991 RepID=UPI000416D728|nr:efflux RND transporter periplasmic adaptor subunit [Aneurinibacillus terranovensis]
MRGALKLFIFLVIPVTVFLLLLGGAFTDKIKPGVAASETPKEVRGVPVGKVSNNAYQAELSVPGTVVTKEETMVSSKLMAPVEKILVKKGQLVKQGQPLVLLDQAQVSTQANQAKAGITAAQVAQQSVEKSIELAQSGVLQANSAVQQALTGVQDAQARYQNATDVYNRSKTLFENGAISRQDYDNAKTNYDTARIAVDKAKAALAQANDAVNQAKAAVGVAVAKRGEAGAQIQQAEAGYAVANVSVSDATIRAPFDGMVVDTLVHEGDMASPGTPLLTMEQQPYYLETYVDERKMEDIAVGNKIPITIEALHMQQTGTVAEITPHIDPASRKFRVKILLPQTDGLMSGLFGEAAFPDGGDQSIFIPQDAIVHWSQFTGVYVVDENSISHLRYVSLGRTSGPNVEVLSGLKAGERIVTSSVDKVTDKARVVAAP